MPDDEGSAAGSSEPDPADETPSPDLPDRHQQASYVSFVRENMRELRRYALGLTANWDDAHDILSESLIKAYLAWPRIARMDHPLGYIRKIIVNTLISDGRKWYTQNIAPYLTESVPDVPTRDLYLRVQQIDELNQLLTILPKRQTAMIVMRYYLNLSDLEISDHLGCSAVTVRSTISRALSVIRDARLRGDE